VLIAEASQQSTELKILRHLDKCARDNPWRENIIASLDDFTFEGSNGAHLRYVSQPGGPSISMMSDSPGEVAATRRLRADLALKLCGQLAKAASLIHDVGIVHGDMLITGGSWDILTIGIDITPKNVLLKLRGVGSWPTEVIYEQLGFPITEEVYRRSVQVLW
jgi:serine/threonine protein kinase